MLLGGANAGQQWVYWQEEISQDHTCRSLPQISSCAMRICCREIHASPYYKTKYGRIPKRRGKKRAIIAIVRMILTAVYQMLSTSEIWNPCDLYKTDMPLEMQDRQKAKTIKQALKLLTSEEITVLQPAPIAVTA